MKATLVHAVLLSASMWSLQLVGGSDTEVVQIKPTAAVPSVVAALSSAGTGDSAGRDGGGRDSGGRDGGGRDGDGATAPAAAAVAAAASAADDGASPCDRYQRASEPEVRNPRNHKFVTSNGWANRQRPKPEINVYSRVEEVPTVQSPSSSTAAYYRQQQQHQHQTYYQQQPLPRQQPPTVRTSKRIIYYATLPDVIRRPQPGYAQLQQQQLQTDPFALGPGPFSADYRQLDRSPPSDGLQPGRLAPYENAYDRGGAVTSVTSKSTAVYSGRYDEPAEFRDSFYRPNELTTGAGTSRFAPWAEPFYKSWTSSAWDKDRSSFPWDDRRPSRWDDRGALASWENRGSSWDKDLVEVPLQRKPPAGPSNRNDYEPEVAVIKSGVIDVRGDRQPPSPPPPPQSRFTIVDVDPKPYNPQMPQREDVREYDHRQQQQQQKPLRYEAAYTPIQPIQPPGRFADRQPPPSMHYEQQYPPPPPLSSVRYDQQYPPPPSPTRNGQNQPPSNGYYETMKNTHHQFMTSWTEVTEHGDGEVTPTHAVSVDVVSAGNNTSKLNSTRTIPNTINVTAKSPK